MAKHASPFTVGIFVVTAVVLAIAGILVLGSGEFFRDEYKVVAHFRSSISGLDIGAPVRFQGVDIGRVSSFYASWEDNFAQIRIPVELTIVSGRVRPPRSSSEEWDDMDHYGFIQHLIDERGLRAELRQDSFVTGKLFVAFDFRPELPAHKMGGTDLVEIPTVQTGLERFAKSIQELPLDELVDRALAVLESIETAVGNPEIELTIENLNDVLEGIEAEIDPLSTSTQETLADARTFMENADVEMRALSEDAQALMSTVDSEVKPLAESAIAALDQARVNLANLDQLIGQDYTLFYRSATLLRELAEAARSFRVLADYLERHPEALLFGKEK